MSGGAIEFEPAHPGTAFGPLTSDGAHTGRQRTSTPETARARVHLPYS